MGWSSGATLFQTLAENISSNVSDEDERLVVYEEMINAFDAHDCDDLSYLIGEVDHILDEALRDFYNIEEDEDEEDEDDWPDGGREDF